MYYKQVEENEIKAIGRLQNNVSGLEEISEEKYNLLSNLKKPKDTLETVYFLSNETENYEVRERTPGEVIEWYAGLVLNGASLEEVPEEYRTAVEAYIASITQERTYTLDEASEIISQEVSKQ